MESKGEREGGPGCGSRDATDVTPFRSSFQRLDSNIWTSVCVLRGRDVMR